MIRPSSRLVFLCLSFARRPRLAHLPLLVFFLAGLLRPLAATPSDSTAATTAQPAANTVSQAEYQARLQSLDQLIVSCQRAMIPANCQSDQVGPDIKLALPSASRQIRFAWLRELLDAASNAQAAKDKAAKYRAAIALGPQTEKKAPPAPPIPKPEFHRPTLAQQLEDARQRLAADAQYAQQFGAPASSPSAASPSTNPSPQRQVLTRILAAKEYQAAVARPSLLHQLQEKVGNWLDRLIARLKQAGFRSKWIGLTAEISFGVLVCVALAWFLIRLERQGRLGAIGFRPEAAAGAPSARDWQLWLKDAEKAAAEGAWRDAIHFLYWASISRMESGGLWPADRTRTPREYLVLLSPKSAQQSDLVKLTRSFERTWYGGRPAAEADFHKAEQVAAHLGAKLDAKLDAKPASATPSDSREAQ